MFEVTVKFKDQKQFEGFLKKNKIEDYTWHKGQITIDLSGMVDQAMEDAPDRLAKIENPPAAETPSQDDFPV